VGSTARTVTSTTDFAIRVDPITPSQKDKNPGMPDCGVNGFSFFLKRDIANAKS
jgi:hypothetical protein